MANSNYQTAASPRLYVSYPLWQYANGALDSISSSQLGNTNEDFYRLLQLDPSNFTNLNLQSNNTASLIYRILPQADNFTDLLNSNLWNFNYAMFLGHNFASAGAIPKIKAMKDDGNETEINTTNIINHSPNSVPEYDGFSIMGLNGAADSDDYNFKIDLDALGNFNDSLFLGSLSFGKYFDFPQNCNLNTTTKYDYGIKQKNTISGKTISTANWTKPNNWITEPFGLTEAFGERGDNFQRRSGRRSWSLSFDSLAPKYVMNQNPMMNDNGWKYNYDNFDTTDSNNSLYNINNANDFYTTVVHRSMSSHLPMVLQLDKNNPSPEQMAIVRLNKDFKISQKSPNLYNIKLTLTEQI